MSGGPSGTVGRPPGSVRGGAGGTTVTSYPDRVDVLAGVEPVYVTLPGWHSDVGDVREPAGLPAGARDLLQLVEDEVGVPVRVVGVGAERDDYLIWQ